jgi:glutamyl/glutaminyl-tRNA synthetase
LFLYAGTVCAKVLEEQQRLKLPLRYDGTCRKLDQAKQQNGVAAVCHTSFAFKNPKEGNITVHDHLRGDITFENYNRSMIIF